MIDDGTKQKFLEELEKNGNVFLTCLKTGIHRSTYYRWKKDDKGFNKKASEADRHGRENNCDIAGHVLMLKVKDKDLNAIKYLLSHNSPRYKLKRMSNVVILHKTMPKNLPGSEISLQGLIHKMDEMDGERYSSETERIKKKYESIGIPPKADGTAISEEELIDYEKYIEEWYKKRN